MAAEAARTQGSNLAPSERVFSTSMMALSNRPTIEAVEARAGSGDAAGLGACEILGMAHVLAAGEVAEEVALALGPDLEQGSGAALESLQDGLEGLRLLRADLAGPCLGCEAAQDARQLVELR